MWFNSILVEKKNFLKRSSLTSGDQARDHGYPANSDECHRNKEVCTGTEETRDRQDGELRKDTE